MTAEAAMQRAIAGACLGAEAGEALTRDLRAFLQEHGVAPDDVEAALAAPSRLAVYRVLVRNGLSSVVVRMLPRTRARMNAACDGRFDADVARFVDDVGPRTHYLRDVPAELFAWAEARWRADPSVPPYLPDLAAHELAHFAVASSDATGAADANAGAAVALDQPLAFTPSTRLQRYAWAVHELPADEDARDEPPRRAVRLLAYRDPEHQVRWLEMTPLAFAVVERLTAGEPLGLAVERACAEHATQPAAVLADIALLLSDLASRGVLLGARGS
jgi:hypothetical protein